MNMQPSIGVVIPAHNAADVIGDQLSALAHQTFEGSFTTTVVLNCCTDATLETVQRYGDVLDLRIVTANEHAGAGYARNRGVAASPTDIILFCDADDRVHPEWVANMVQALEASSVVGGRLVRWTSSDSVVASHRPVEQESMLPRDRHGTPYAITASMGVRRDVFERVGGFSENPVIQPCEDVEFGLRAIRCGFDIRFAENAVCDYRMRSSSMKSIRQFYSYGRGSTAVEQIFYPAQKWRVLRELAKIVMYGGRLVWSRSRGDVTHRFLRLVYQIGRTSRTIVPTVAASDTGTAH